MQILKVFLQEQFGTRKKFISSTIYVFYIYLLGRKYAYVIKYFSKLFAEMFYAIFKKIYLVIKAEFMLVRDIFRSFGGRYLVSLKRVFKAFVEYYKTLDQIFVLRRRKV